MDDTLLLCDAEVDQFNNQRYIIMVSSSASLEKNLKNCEIIIVKVVKNTTLANVLRCKWIPSDYLLGLSLGARHKKREAWNAVMEKVKRG